MDSLTTAELLELLAINTELTDAQFQYWLAITSAVIVAGFTGRDQIGRKLGIAISTLYILVSFLFLGRYFQVTGNYQLLATLAIERGIPLTANPIPLLPIRLLVILIGTGISLWYLNYKKGEAGDDET